MDPSELVQSLCALLGTKLVAYLGSVDDTRTVCGWADPADARIPPDDAVDRLRIAHHVAVLLAERDPVVVVQAWFQGRNPLLGDAAPARLIRDDALDATARRVTEAALAFLADPAG